MTPDVAWANGWEGGHVRVHDAVREYWTRQWRELDPTVTPLEITASGEQAVVVVDQDIRQSGGRTLRSGVVTHRYALRDGLITRMDIVAEE